MTTEGHWAWRVPDTGRPSSFDEEACRARACEEDTNPKGSPFFASPGKDRFEP